MRLHNSEACVLISPENQQIIQNLNMYGIKIAVTKPVEKLIPYEQYHADLQMLVIDDIAFIPQESKYLEEVAKRFFLKPVVCDPIGGEYPANVALNAALIGNKLMCREASLSEKVKSYCNEKGIEILDVKQGYTNCSTLVLNENAIITADVGIHRVAAQNSIESLLIRPGFISLTGADYGFIGGASMVVGDKVLFFGDINTHPDSKKIIDFTNKNDMHSVSLTNDKLTDLGGAVNLRV